MLTIIDRPIEGGGVVDELIDGKSVSGVRGPELETTSLGRKDSWTAGEELTTSLTNKKGEDVEDALRLSLRINKGLVVDAIVPLGGELERTEEEPFISLSFEEA